MNKIRQTGIVKILDSGVLIKRSNHPKSKNQVKSRIQATCRALSGAVCTGAILLITSNARAQNLFVSAIDGDIVEIAPSGSESTYASGLNDPGQLAFDSSGDLFVGTQSATGGTITEITPGGVGSTFASGFGNGVSAMAFNSSGDLFAANQGNGTISEITPGGVQSTFASGLTGPIGLAFNSAGSLFVGSSGGTISEITPGGVQSTFASGFGSGISALAFNSSGDLFVASQERSIGEITEITPGGEYNIFAEGVRNGFQGLAFDSSGDLFTVQSVGGGSRNILEFTPDAEEYIIPVAFEAQFLAFDPVPEPPVLRLLAIAAAALLGRRKLTP